MKKMDSKSLEGVILKRDDEQRLVYGWAYVSTMDGQLSVDHSGETIDPDTLAKAATDFMLDVRIAKAMHQGDAVGSVVHSLPLTKEIATSLGIETNREGWIVAMKIHSDEVWELVKSGRLASFSIGGRAKREVNHDH
jgi:hypothetical protein